MANAVQHRRGRGSAARTRQRRAPRAARPNGADADVAQALRERIASHAIPPGAKLQEAVLAKEFGASRARVREALNELEFRGLIRRIPNRGAEVMRLDLTQVYEIYDAREALEGMAVRLATEKAPPETWQEWVERLAPGGAMEQLLEKGDVEEYFLTYERLRRQIIEAAENPVLAGMLDSVLEKTRVIMRRVQILPGRAAAGLAEHRAFVAAMRAGDAEKAEQLRRANIRSAIQTLKRFQNFIL